MAKTLTVDKLIADHAEPLAKAISITLDDQDRTPAGFPFFLETVAEHLSLTDQTSEWLYEAADVLNDGAKTQEALREVDQILHDARADLGQRG